VGGATNRLVGPPHPTLSPGQRRPAGGEGKGRVVRATLRRQIFEQPVVTLSPDSPATPRERGDQALRAWWVRVALLSSKLRSFSWEVKRSVAKASLRQQTLSKDCFFNFPGRPCGCPDAQPFRPGVNWSLMRRFGREQIGRVGRLQRREASGGDAVLRHA
jgi:hypothetical protein